MQSEEYIKAKRKALSLLAFGDNSKAALMRKLSMKGFSRECAESVTDEMVTLGYVNENRQIKRIILSELASHPIGPRKLYPKILSKGYERAELSRAVSELSESGELDFSAERERLISSLPLGTSREERDTILYKSGF